MTIQSRFSQLLQDASNPIQSKPIQPSHAHTEIKSRSSQLLQHASNPIQSHPITSQVQIRKSYRNHQPPPSGPPITAKSVPCNQRRISKTCGASRWPRPHAPGRRCPRRRRVACAAFDSAAPRRRPKRRCRSRARAPYIIRAIHGAVPSG